MMHGISDIITDACYDKARQSIITARRHIREVTINLRGHVSASQAGSSTDAGPITHVVYCPHTLHLIVCAANEATVWRARDGRPEAVITGLEGKFFPFESNSDSAEADGSVHRDEITALCLCDENIPLPNGEPNATLIFGSAAGEIAAHDSYEGRKLWTMAIFEQEKIVLVQHVQHMERMCYLIATEAGKLAFVRNKATINRIGTKAVDLCWTM